MVGITGSYIPFPDTEDERMQLGDPRRSILARYGSPEWYVEAIRKAALSLVEEGVYARRGRRAGRGRSQELGTAAPRCASLMAPQLDCVRWEAGGSWNGAERDGCLPSARSSRDRN